MSIGLKVLSYHGDVIDAAKKLRRNRAQRIKLGIEHCQGANAVPTPDDDLDLGIAILRTLPERSLEYRMAELIDWPLAGLMHWAAANDPTHDNFDRVWDDLRQLYPRAPGYWHEMIGSIEARYADMWVVRPLFGKLLHPRPTIAEAKAAGTIYLGKRRRLGDMPRELFELCS